MKLSSFIFKNVRHVDECCFSKYLYTISRLLHNLIVILKKLYKPQMKKNQLDAEGGGAAPASAAIA